jgi:hypothetical protein
MLRATFGTHARRFVNRDLGLIFWVQNMVRRLRASTYVVI